MSEDKLLSRKLWQHQLQLEQVVAKLQIPAPLKMNYAMVEELLGIQPVEVGWSRDYEFTILDKRNRREHIKFWLQTEEDFYLWWSYFVDSLPDEKLVIMVIASGGIGGPAGCIVSLAQFLAKKIWPDLEPRIEVPFTTALTRDELWSFDFLQGAHYLDGKLKYQPASDVSLNMWLATGTFPQVERDRHHLKWNSVDVGGYELKYPVYGVPIITSDVSVGQTFDLQSIPATYLPVIGVDIVYPQDLEKPIQFTAEGTTFMESESGAGFVTESGSTVKFLRLPRKQGKLVCFQRQFFIIP